MTRRTGALAFVALLSIIATVACGGGGANRSGAGTVNVTLSDPPTCSDSAGPPAGPFHSIIVTVTKVQLHTSSTAGDNDPGWMDVVSGLTKQIDLLSPAASQCFLATLGTNTALPAGTYQQARIFLAPNNTTVPNNLCGNAGANCVVLSSDLNNPRPLQLSSEAQNGIKIPSGQIAGGQFTVGAGQTKTLNIDFNACASIVTLGGGQFRLKPVLRAGEVNTTSSAVEGRIVDNNGGLIPGLKAVVALEQNVNGIDRVVRQTSPDTATGRFSICPVDPGTYALVLVAENGTGVSFATAIITGVGPGSSLGDIKLIPVSGASTALGSITGRVTTVDAASLAISEVVTLSVLQDVSGTKFTIPLIENVPAGATANVNTQTGGTCAVNTACADFTLAVPGVAPTTAAFTSGTPITLTGTPTAPASYTVEAAANCSPASNTSAAVSVSPGASTPLAAPLALTSCN